MRKVDNEPCPVEVPIVREKHIGFRFNKPGRGTVFVRPRDFSVWLTPDELHKRGNVDWIREGLRNYLRGQP